MSNMYTPAREKTPRSVSPAARRPPALRSSLSGTPVLQRKPACACGGSCPRCQAGPSTNLRIGEPDDRYEQEADRIATQVMRTPNPVAQPPPAASNVQRKCTAREDELGWHELQTELAPSSGPLQGEAGSRTTYSLPIVQEVLNSPGQPLDRGTRSFFEPRFGHDFSDVTIHTDAKAAESAEAVNALAYTVGSHAVFGDGNYASATRNMLLAHELAHVVQQRASTPSTNVVEAPSDATGIRQREVHRRSGVLIPSGTAQHPIPLPAPRAVQRQERRAFAEEEYMPVQQAVEQERSRRSCIDMVRRGLTLLLSGVGQKLGTPPKVGGKRGWTMDTMMRRLQDLGLASKPMEFEFLDARGRPTTGTAKPASLGSNASEQIMKAVGSEPGWHLFGLSILNGVHSALLAVHYEDSSALTVHYLDQVLGVRDVTTTLDKFLEVITGWAWDYWLNKSGIRGRSTLRVWPVVLPLLGDFPVRERPPKEASA